MSNELSCLSLELSQKIQEIGIVLDTYHHWIIYPSGASSLLGKGEDQSYIFDKVWYREGGRTIPYEIQPVTVYPAPTVEECPKLHDLVIDSKIHQFNIWYNGNEWNIGCYYSEQYEEDTYIKVFSDKKLCNSIIQMLIWLHESGYIEKGE